MKPFSFCAALMVLVWLGIITSPAQILSGNLQAAAGDVVNLSQAYSFAAYTTQDGVPYTDLTNLGQFSALSGTIAGEIQNSQIEMSFNGVQNGSPNSATNEGYLVYANAGHTLTVTSTLFTTAETFSFYVVSNVGSTTLTATLAGTGVTGTPTYTESSVLPTPSTPDGNTNGYGVLTLAVSGAQAGDVLTFNIEDTNFGYAGLQGVSVVIGAPEPSTYALTLIGAAALLGLHLRKAA